MPLLVIVALIMLGGGVHLSVAQTHPWPRVIENPATTLRTLSPDREADPESEEVWVSSNKPATRSDAPLESRGPQVKQESRPDIHPRMPGLSDIPKISDLTAAILRIRPPKLPGERKGAVKHPASEAELASKDDAKPKPAFRLKLEAGLPRETSPLSQLPEAPQRDAKKPIVPALSDIPTVSDFTTAMLKVRVPKLPLDITGRGTDEANSAEAALKPDVRPEVQTKSLQDTLASIRRVAADRGKPDAPAGLNLATEEGEEKLFHTTSGPVKPAAALFEAMSKPSKAIFGGGVPALDRDGASGLRLPLGPTDEPDIQAPLLAGRLAAKGLTGDTTESAPATSVVGITMPPMWQAVETRGIFTPATQGAGPPRPDAPPDNIAQTPGVRHVVLRMKLAELNRAADRQWGLLEFYRDPSLLRSLLRAEAGQGAVVLDSPDTKKMESELEALTKRGTVRIRSEPTLITRSGQVATFLADGNAAESVTESGNEPSGGDLRVAVTVLPVVTDEDHIRLRVTSKLSGSDSPSNGSGEHSPTTQISTTEVRMRAGQTLAIGGLRHDSAKGGHQQHLPSLGQILGIGATDRPESGLIVLVTPELAEPAQPEAAASVADRDQTKAAEGEVRWPESRRTADRRLWPLRL